MMKNYEKAMNTIRMMEDDIDYQEEKIESNKKAIEDIFKRASMHGSTHHEFRRISEISNQIANDIEKLTEMTTNYLRIQKMVSLLTEEK